jgi:5-methylcytosine-specific restriction protein A
MRKELLKLIQQGNTHKFYKSTEWKYKRKDILKRDNYECQICKHEGKYSKADCVHHIQHIRKVPMLALTDSNLLSICNACHNTEHPEKLIKNVKKGFTNEERWE